MAQGNYKMAWSTLKLAKWRSLLTMFGVIIGVVSVITTVSLGEGVKRQVLGQVNKLGGSLITARPGNIVTRDAQGNITHVNLASSYGYGVGSLSEDDVKIIQQSPHIKEASPVALVASNATVDSTTYTQGVVLGTGSSFADLIDQKIQYGAFFANDEQDQDVAVIGRQVAEELFKENVPIGLSLSIRGHDFVVRGIFDQFQSSPLGTGTDLNRAIIIPYPRIKALGTTPQIVQVLAKADQPANTKDAITAVNKRLKDAHSGQQDVTVLRQDETLTVTSNLLNVLTAFVGGIAAISLLVGGIGIMNIMLVSVSERTREIGLRKAVGATNRQIRSQFLVEAVVLSLVGGITGVILAYAANFLIRVLTNLNPIITWQVVVIAVGVALVVGVLFGVTPAVKAARKDPIEALRYE